MTYTILKFVFYLLLALPVFACGLYFFVRLWKDVISVKKTQIREKENRKKAKADKKAEELRKERFYREIDEKRGYR